MSETNSSAKPQAADLTGRRSIRWKLGCMVLLILLLVAHRPLLRLVARPLVADGSLGQATAILLLGGDRCFDVAAKQLQDGRVESILLPAQTPGRLERLGIYPTWDVMTRRELEKRGVPADLTSTLPGPAGGRAQNSKNLARWLQQHPDSRVVVLVDRFSSGVFRDVCDRELDLDILSRLTIVGLADRRFDETNWWYSRTGIKALCAGWLTRGYAWARGDAPPRRRRVDADEYEAALFQ